MAKHGGIRDIVSLFHTEREDNNRRFLSIGRISERTGISQERVRRILARNTTICRESRGRNPDVWTLLEFDRR